MSMELVAALRAEEARLVSELEKTPLFQKLDAVRRTIALYDNLGHADRASRVGSARVGTVSSVVLDNAEEFLRMIGHREQAPAITQELFRRGVLPNIDVQTVRSVASYLSTAKDRFNNVRGQGYGLAEWPASAPSDDVERPSSVDADGGALPPTAEEWREQPA